MNKYNFGWNPDIPSPLDFDHAPVLSARLLPRKFSNRSLCTDVEEQEAGSCVAEAWIGAMEMLDHADDNVYVDLSSHDLYYHARKLRGMQDSDAGSQLRDGAKVLAKRGVCELRLWPRDMKKLYKDPPQACDVNAEKHMILVYERTTTVHSRLSAIASKQPVVFGAALYDSFLTDAVKKSGNVPMPKPLKEKEVGGHAMCIVGYDLDRDGGFGCYEVRNSWGKKWGIVGYCWIPCRYLDNPYLASDFWTASKVGGVIAVERKKKELATLRLAA
jgi:hypothetical protein